MAETGKGADGVEAGGPAGEAGAGRVGEGSAPPIPLPIPPPLPAIPPPPALGTAALGTPALETAAPPPVDPAALLDGLPGAVAEIQKALDTVIVGQASAVDAILFA